MTNDWSGHCLLSYISWCTLYMQVREIIWLLSLQLEMKFRIVKNTLWVVFKSSIKEFCPRVPKDVIDWRIVVSWIVIFVINVCKCGFLFLFVLFCMTDWFSIGISNLFLSQRKYDNYYCKTVFSRYFCVHTDINSWNNSSSQPGKTFVIKSNGHVLRQEPKSASCFSNRTGHEGTHVFAVSLATPLLLHWRVEQYGHPGAK